MSAPRPDIQLRLTDRPSIAVEVDVCAPPERVWGFVIDPSVPARFSDELVRAEWLDGVSTPAVGSRFRGWSYHPELGEWSTISFVTNVEPLRVFEWAVADPDQPASLWRFELLPARDVGDTVVLRQWMQLGPGPSGVSYAVAVEPHREHQIISERLDLHRENMRRCVQGVKSLAEDVRDDDA